MSSNNKQNCTSEFFPYFYWTGAKPVDPRIYISSKLGDSYLVSINDRKQWEHLNGIQLLLADLISNKDFNNTGLSKTLDEVRFSNMQVLYIFVNVKIIFRC